MFLVGSRLRFRSILIWIVHTVACMGGCLGSDNKPKLVTSVDGPLKGPKTQVRRVSKPSISEDFWTTSTCEMDNSALHSLGSISSISTSNLTIDPHGSTSGSISSEFVNHGLLLWNQTRQQWIGNKKHENRAHQLREPRLRSVALFVSNLLKMKEHFIWIFANTIVDLLVI
ncbi:hypothetical protein U1Q18_006740 [Sarracenia purpurea var. burkii]